MAKSLQPIANRPSVTLLSLAHNSIAGSTENRHSLPHHHSVQRLAEALTQNGWHVDLFVGVEQLDKVTTKWLAPYCRLIHLLVETPTTQGGSGNDLSGNNLKIAKIAQQIEAFQIKSGLLNPLLHTFDPDAAEVGDFIKRKKGWRWLHSCDGSAHPFCDDASVFAADQILLHGMKRGNDQEPWEPWAIALDTLYRQHLAAYVGATDISVPRILDLSKIPQIEGAIAKPTPLRQSA